METKARLPKADRKEAFHTFHVEVPIELWNRMVNEAGLTWGRGADWAREAFREKLDREKAAEQTPVP